MNVKARSAAITSPPTVILDIKFTCYELSIYGYKYHKMINNNENYK